MSAVLGKETIAEFFENIFSGNDLLESYNLSKAYLGPNKTSLDLINLNVELLQAVTLFGYYLKFFCSERKDQYWPSPNSAIVVLMNSRRMLNKPRLPSKISRDGMKKICYLMM